MNKFFFLTILILSSLNAISQDFQIKNDAKRGQKKGYYNWRIYLVGHADTLRKIKEVTYTLHPTFKYPVQTVTYKQSRNFEYKASGWGEFEIKVKVVYNDKRRYPLFRVHHLDLRVK